MKNHIAWAAGFFDGEGHVAAKKPYKNEKARPLLIHIEQTDRRVLDRFCKIVKVGKVYGPYVSSNPKHSSRFVYSVHRNAEVLKVWKLLQPYLSILKCQQFITSITARKAALSITKKN